MGRRALACVALVVVVAAPACARRIRVAAFEVEGHPSSVTVVGDRVWVTDDVNHEVHVLDARSGDVERRIDVPRIPIAAAAGGGSVWIAHATGRVTAIDARTSEVRDRKVGGSLTGVAYAMGRVWLTDLERSELVEVDPDTLRAVDRIAVPKGAVRVAAGPGRALWVTNSEDTATQVVDGRVVRVRDVGLGPIGLASDGRTVWIANGDDDSVTPLRGSRGEPAEEIGVGGAPVAVAVVGTDAWSVDQDAGTLTSLQRPDAPPIELGTHPRGAVGVEWFGHREIWAVGSNPDRVVRVQL